MSGPRRPHRIRFILGSCFLLLTPSISPGQSPKNADDSAIRDYLSGNGLLNRGLYELAIGEYEKFLAAHGDHEKAPIARYGLAVSLFRLDRHDDALVELNRLAKRSGFGYAAEVATMIGQCHLAAGRYAPAAQAFEIIITRHKKHDLAPTAFAGATEALYRDGKYAAASQRGQAMVARWPKHTLRERVEFFVGLSEMGRAEYDLAAMRFADLLKRFPTGPFVDQSALLLAQCYHNTNATKKAIQQYRDVLQQKAGKFTSDALYALGSLLYDEGSYDQAGDVLDRLLNDDSDSLLAKRAVLQRARIFFAQDDFKRAFVAFKVSGGVDQKTADRASYWMAKCKLRLEDFVAAAERFANAIEEFPTSVLLPEMYYDRAVALLRADNRDDAVKVLATFRSLYPDHTLSASALHMLATTEHQQTRYDRSRVHCSAFLEQFPDHEATAALRFLSAENEFLSQRYAEAVDGYRTFLNRHAGDERLTKARFRLATALQRLDRFDEAEPLFDSVASSADTDDTFRSALMSLGDIHFQRGEWTKAESRFDQYLCNGLDVPLADDALLKMGFAKQRQGKFAEALSDFDRLLESFEESPQRLQAVFERGQALVALDRDEEAVEAFGLVISLGGEHSRFAPYALNHLATIAMQGKWFANAAKLYHRAQQVSSDEGMAPDLLFHQGQALIAAGDFPAAEARLRRLLDRHPDSKWTAQGKAQLAISLARQDRYDDALVAIAQLERDGADSLDAKLRAALGYEKAWCLRALGKEEQAGVAYRELLAAGDGEGLNLHAMLELGEVEAQAKRFESAAKILRELRAALVDASDSDTQPLREQCTYRLAVCEFELSRFDRASQLFEEFIQRFPQSALIASAYFYAGEACFQTNKHDRAAQHLLRVTQQHPSDAVAGPGLLRLGESLAVLQRWAASERTFTEYLSRYSDTASWYQAQFGLGWALENQKRCGDAIPAYEKVVARHRGPTAARAQFQIGQCLFATGKLDDAVRELLKVDILYAYPQWSAAAVFEAARCFEKLSQPGKAVAHYRQVQERFGETDWAQLAQRRLSELLSTAALPGD